MDEREQLIRTKEKELFGRRKNLEYFDLARSLGPQVFLDTLPALVNAIILVTLGGIALYDPFVLSDSRNGCGATVEVFLGGLMAFSYYLIGVLAYFVFGKQVTISIRIPYLLILLWSGVSLAWTFVGIGAISSDAYRNQCRVNAPFTYGFTLLELVLSPLIAGMLLFQWTGKTILEKLRQCRARYFAPKASAGNIETLTGLSDDAAPSDVHSNSGSGHSANPPQTASSAPSSSADSAPVSAMSRASGGLDKSQEQQKQQEQQYEDDLEETEDEGTEAE